MLRYYYKLDRKGQPILGSNNTTQSRDIKSPFIKFFEPLCCKEEDEGIYSSAPIKYFVRIDGRDLPVPFTLIKRQSAPNGRWMEVFPTCCQPTT